MIFPFYVVKKSQIVWFIFQANKEISLNFKAGRYSKGGDVQGVQSLSPHLQRSAVRSAINSALCTAVENTAKRKQIHATVQNTVKCIV